MDKDTKPQLDGETEDSPSSVPSQKIRMARYLFAGLLLLSAVLLGIGTFTFGYGKGASYLSNDPNSCANCHVMQEHLHSWQKSSHHHVATCNDCHLSHHPIGKWVTKGDNGFFHSLAFTLGNYPDPIQIKPRNKVVTQNACIGCHEDFVHSLLPTGEEVDSRNEAISCVHCHFDVGHAHRGYSTGSSRESMQEKVRAWLLPPENKK